MPIPAIIAGAAALGAAGVSAYSSWKNMQEQEDFNSAQNDFNANEAVKARAYNTQMTHEAYARDDAKYQRLVKDLKSSGINPMLATGNPTASQSSAPQGPMASASGAARAPQIDTQSLMQAALIDSQIQLNKANADKASADARATPELTQSTVNTNAARIREIDERIKNYPYERDKLQFEKDKIAEETLMVILKRDLGQQNFDFNAEKFEKELRRMDIYNEIQQLQRGITDAKFTEATLELQKAIKERRFEPLGTNTPEWRQFSEIAKFWRDLLLPTTQISPILPKEGK